MPSFNSDTAAVEDGHFNRHIHNTFGAMYNDLSSISDAYGSSLEDLAFEEAFYDPDDIHLEPRQRHRSKASKPKQYSETKVVLPIHRTSRKHYAFPIEVLELVCSHLSQATLRCAVSLVCKEWSNASRRFIQRVGVWNNATAERENRLLEQMPSLVTLECSYSSITGSRLPRDMVSLDQPGSISWDRFKTAITAPLSASNENQTADPASPQCLLHYIRRLVLKGPQMTYEISIPRILHQLHFLQSLHLHVQSTHIPLFKLLDRSPGLQELKVVCQMYQVAQLLSGDDEDLIPEKPVPVINPETAHFPRKPPVVIPPKAYPHRYRLRVFEVDYVIVKQRVLERVIATCPDLRVFKLHDINPKIWVPELSVTKYLPIDEERLWNHLQNCCPKVEWYHLFQLATTSVDEKAALGRMHRNKALGRFMTTICIRSMNDYLQSLEVRLYLKNITVLEILPTVNFPATAITLHRLLCLMPNLLHLIATRFIFRATEVLQLPEDATSKPRRAFNHHNRGRKRQEREERREQRQIALGRFQGREHGRLSIPDDWQCRDLRTMAIDFGALATNSGTFTRYVEFHHLLRNLTSLSIKIDALKVGQLKYQAAPLRQFPKKSAQKSRSHAKPRATQVVSAKSETQTAEVLPPERWENEFLMLRGLRCLETLDIKSTYIMGTVHATDFEFLRKENHSHVMVFIADKNKDAGSDDDGDSPGNEKCGRRKDRTFWPHLQSLYIRHVSAQVATDFAEVVAGVRHIRPGVEFGIKQTNVF